MPKLSDLPGHTPGIALAKKVEREFFERIAFDRIKHLGADGCLLLALYSHVEKLEARIKHLETVNGSYP
jgi:hypothetical protein